MNLSAGSCGDCGAFIAEPMTSDVTQRKPCPQCGSTLRAYKPEFIVNSQSLVRLEGKQKRPDFRKRGGSILEFILGADRSSDGTYASKYRLIYRLNDRYVERVVTQDGSIAQDVDIH
jgi:hypothetical protein